MPPAPPQPGYAGAPLPPPPPAKKRRALPWILGGLAVLLLLCCGGVGITLMAGKDAVDQAVEDLEASAAASAPAGDEPAQPVEEETDEPATAETQNMAVGETLIITSNKGDELRVTVTKVTSRAKACDDYMPAPESGKFVIATVQVKVVKGTGSVNPLYFTFVKPDGTTDNGISGAFSGCGKALASGNNLPTGSVRSGQLVFDVNPAKGQIVYEDIIGGGVLGSWKIG
jgi:hypothetical protein